VTLLDLTERLYPYPSVPKGRAFLLRLVPRMFLGNPGSGRGAPRRLCSGRPAVKAVEWWIVPSIAGPGRHHWDRTRDVQPLPHPGDQITGLLHGLERVRAVAASLAVSAGHLAYGMVEPTSRINWKLCGPSNIGRCER
jgi:hypothetical protein